MRRDTGPGSPGIRLVLARVGPHEVLKPLQAQSPALHLVHLAAGGWTDVKQPLEKERGGDGEVE